MKVDRSTLALARVDDFRAWAEAVGYVSQPTKGIWELLRLRRGDERPLIYYKRAAGGRVHASCGCRDAARLVRRWIRERED